VGGAVAAEVAEEDGVVQPPAPAVVDGVADLLARRPVNRRPQSAAISGMKGRPPSAPRSSSIARISAVCTSARRFRIALKAVPSAGQRVDGAAAGARHLARLLFGREDNRYPSPYPSIQASHAVELASR
jgi:hypothetical protein